MENIVLYLLKYAVVFFIEIIVYGSFIYLASTKNKSEVSRRWKASGLVSILFGLLIHFCFLVIIFLGLISNVNIETMFTDLGGVFIEIFSAIIGFAAIITMPVLIIGTLFAYYNFWKTGDRLIEKYWRNPKVHYDENAKPPFLKF